MATPGEVVSIRLSTKDCMSVADLIHLTGIYYPGMSFSQAVALALSSSLQTMREANLIPTRDGFEYAELMEKFTFSHRRLRQTVTGKHLHLPAVQTPASSNNPLVPLAKLITQESINQTVLSIDQAVEELDVLIKKENLTEVEQSRVKELEKLIYG